MDLKTLREVAELMEEHGLTRIKLDEKDLKLDIERESALAGLDLKTALAATLGAMPAAPVAMPPAPAPTAVPAPAAPAPAAPSAPALTTADGTPCDSSRVTEVCAPMTGVFYVASAPGAEPFARLGSKVKKGDTLCILEAMKVMNEVAAECDGEIVEVCASDGELVEYGSVLFRIY